MNKHSQQPAAADVELLNEKLQLAKEREKRALADYQNLIRRNREDRIQLIKMANKDLLTSLLQPLDYLEKATAQIDNQGLKMALDQLKQALKEIGLEEIKVMGQKFDLETMEVVDKKGEGDAVVEVMNKGYTLNGEVILHAKVVLG